MLKLQSADLLAAKTVRQSLVKSFGFAGHGHKNGKQFVCLLMQFYYLITRNAAIFLQ